MALTLSLLTTKAECDDALADLNAELDAYTQRTSNLSFADRQSGRSSAETSGRLAAVNGEIAGFTASLATTGLPIATRKALESKLRRANDRKDNLTERGEARTGSAAFLATVDAEQLARQVAVLTDAIAQVTAYQATLPA